MANKKPSTKVFETDHRGRPKETRMRPPPMDCSAPNMNNHLPQPEQHQRDHRVYPQMIDYASAENPQPRMLYSENSQRTGDRLSLQAPTPQPRNKMMINLVNENSGRSHPRIIDYSSMKPQPKMAYSMEKPTLDLKTQTTRMKYSKSDQRDGRPASEFSPATANKMKHREPFREVASPQNMSSGPLSPPPGPGTTFNKIEEMQQQYTVDEEEEKFELMNVTVVVYGLSGICIEKEVTKKKRSKFSLTNKDKSTSKVSEGSVNGISRRLYSGSTISSTDVSASEELNYIENNAPTTAVVSYRKNAFSSQTSLETFLPSVPLHHPTSSHGCKFRYKASWPSEQSALEKDEKAIEMSSFKLTRCMKQGAFVPGAGAGSNYVHETLDLRINLSRGTELIRLGTASLVISGEEEGEVQINVPAKPIVHKTKKTSKNRFKSGKGKAKSNKYGYFCDDPTRRYFLDENATLRVGIQVIPEETVRFAEEREREENDLRQMLGSNNLKNAFGRMGGNNNPEKQKKSFHHFAFPNELPENVMGQGIGDAGGCSQPPRSLFPNIFCGAMLCAPGAMVPEPKATELPLKMIHTTNEVIDFGAASLISSVSESTDDSEFSDDELEEHMNNFRPATAAIS